MSKRDVEQIDALIAELDRLCEDAQEIRRKISTVARQRAEWPARGQDGRFLEAAEGPEPPTRPPRRQLG